jgi:hypothetical protein
VFGENAHIAILGALRGECEGQSPLDAVRQRLRRDEIGGHAAQSGDVIERGARLCDLFFVLYQPTQVKRSLLHEELHSTTRVGVRQRRPQRRPRILLNRNVWAVG